MKKVRITVMRKACYLDLMEQYENPIEHACDMEEGQVFIADGWQRPVHVVLCHGACPWCRGLLRWLDEESSLGDDFLQRRLSPGEFSLGSDG